MGAIAQGLSPNSSPTENAHLAGPVPVVSAKWLEWIMEWSLDAEGKPASAREPLAKDRTDQAIAGESYAG